jgi:hypothetical protein
MITGTWLNNFNVQKSQRTEVKQVREISAHVRKISIIIDYEMIDIFLTLKIIDMNDR